MIVDPSAIIAILRDEDDADRYTEALLGTPGSKMSAAGYLEATIVIDRVGDPVLSRRFDELLDGLGVEVVSVSPEHAHTARTAYRDFGKGSGHPAGLNFGDCFSYALAVTSGEPLLFKGEDFVHTDVRPALQR